MLTDDWELRGDGSGNERAIQFDTMRRLAHVYERYGLRGSFNAEVMQQLWCRRLADRHPELGQLADEWERLVRETYARGHDVQLHLHPQWSDASYADGRWQLRGAWSLLDYSEPEARELLQAGKDYLEAVLRPVDNRYRCVSFRSGSWCIAPSEHILRTLSTLGIGVETSIVNGLFYQSPHVKLDYRHIDEPFLPYYPEMQDARRVAASPQPIVSVPTHSFNARLMGYGLRLAARTVQRRTGAVRRLTSRFVAPRDVAIPNAGYERTAYFRSEWDVPPLEGLSNRKTKVSDLCGLSYFQMREMLRDIRRRARQAGIDPVPVVLQNHTKDIGDFAPLEHLARDIAEASDVQVITLSELARGLEAGDYPVRLASSAG